MQQEIDLEKQFSKLCLFVFFIHLLKLLDIVHPAARTLVDIARAQDAEVGDGTTSVVLLAAQLRKEGRGYIEEGVSPHIIMKGFRKAAELVSEESSKDTSA